MKVCQKETWANYDFLTNTNVNKTSNRKTKNMAVFSSYLLRVFQTAAGVKSCQIFHSYYF